jgi:hypothetical protein
VGPSSLAATVVSVGGLSLIRSDHAPRQKASLREAIVLSARSRGSEGTTESLERLLLPTVSGRRETTPRNGEASTVSRRPGASLLTSDLPLLPSVTQTLKGVGVIPVNRGPSSATGMADAPLGSAPRGPVPLPDAPLLLFQRSLRGLRFGNSVAFQVEFEPIAGDEMVWQDGRRPVRCLTASRLVLRTPSLQSILRDSLPIVQSLELLDEQGKSRQVGDKRPDELFRLDIDPLTLVDSVFHGNQTYGGFDALKPLRLPKRALDLHENLVLVKPDHLRSPPSKDAGHVAATTAATAETNEEPESLDAFLVDRGNAIESFRDAWRNRELQAYAAKNPWGVYCTCGCGERWGTFHTFAAHPGVDQLWMTSVRNAHAYHNPCALLMQSNGEDLGGNITTVSFRGWNVSPGSVEQLVKAGSTVRFLELGEAQCQLVTSATLVKLLSATPLLEEFRLVACDALTLEVLEKIRDLPCSATLMRLGFPECINIDDACVEEIAASFKNLMWLNVSKCPRVTDRALSSLATLCSQLMALDVSWCHQVSHVGIAALTSAMRVSHLGARGIGTAFLPLPQALRAVKIAEELVAAESPGKANLAAACKPQFVVNVNSHSVLESFDEWKRKHLSRSLALADLSLPSAILQGLSSQDPQVAREHRFSIACGPGMGGSILWLRDQVMGDIVDKQVYLEELDLEDAVGVTDETIVSLVRNCSGLRRFRCGGCHALTSMSTTALSLFCPNLAVLVIRNCTGIASPLYDNDKAVTLARQTRLGLPASLPPVDERAQTSSQKRKGAGLQAVKPAYGPRPPTDDELKELLEPQWVKLRVIDLSDCGKVWETDVVHFFEQCQDLVDFRGQRLENVTDMALESLRTNGIAVRRLVLSGCTSISDSGVEAIARCCPVLEDLDLTGCSGVGDASLEALASSCLSLINLRVSDCSASMSIGGLLRLAQQCRQLRVLEAAARPRPFAPSAGQYAGLKSKEPASMTELMRCRPDSSFDGDMLLFLLCLGVCCPLLRQLDVSGRVPQSRSLHEMTSQTLSDTKHELVRLEKEQQHKELQSESKDERDPLIRQLQEARLAIANSRRGVDRRPIGVIGSNDDHAPATSPREGARTDGIELEHSSEVVFQSLARCVIRYSGELTPAQLRSFVAMCPRLDYFDATGCDGISPASLREATRARTTCEVQIVTWSRESVSDTPLLSGQALSFLGFVPTPGACYTREEKIWRSRQALERQALARIRLLVLHGTGRKKQLLLSILHRCRVHRAARRERAARTIQRAMRAYHEYMEWCRWRAALTIQAFWRRILFVRRCAARVQDAIEAKRAAEMKRLAASMMLTTFDRVWRRMALHQMRVEALISRWEAQRVRDRNRGFEPEFDEQGRQRVRIALPLDGPDVLGERDEHIRRVIEKQLDEAQELEVQERKGILSHTGSGMLLEQVKFTQDKLDEANETIGQLHREMVAMESRSTEERRKHAATPGLFALGGTDAKLQETRLALTSIPSSDARFSGELGVLQQTRYSPSSPTRRPLDPALTSRSSARPVSNAADRQVSNPDARINPFAMKEGPVAVALSRSEGLGSMEAIREQSDLIQFLNAHDGAAAKLDPGSMIHPLSKLDEPVVILTSHLGPRADAIRTLREMLPELMRRQSQAISRIRAVDALDPEVEWRRNRGLTRRIIKAYRALQLREAIRVQVKEKESRRLEQFEAQAKMQGIVSGGGYGIGTGEELLAVLTLQRTVRGYRLRCQLKHVARAQRLERVCKMIRVAEESTSYEMALERWVEALSSIYIARQWLEQLVQQTISLARTSLRFRTFHGSRAHEAIASLGRARLLLDGVHMSVTEKFLGVVDSPQSLKRMLYARESRSESFSDHRVADAFESEARSAFGIAFEGKSTSTEEDCVVYGPHGGKVVMSGDAQWAEALLPSTATLEQRCQEALEVLSPPFRIEHSPATVMERGVLGSEQVLEYMDNQMLRCQAHMSRWRVVDSEATLTEMLRLLEERIPMRLADQETLIMTGKRYVSEWIGRWRACANEMKRAMDNWPASSDPDMCWNKLRLTLRFRLLRPLLDARIASESCHSSSLELVQSSKSWCQRVHEGLLEFRDAVFDRLVQLRTHLGEAREALELLESRQSELNREIQEYDIRIARNAEQARKDHETAATMEEDVRLLESRKLLNNRQELRFELEWLGSEATLVRGAIRRMTLVMSSVTSFLQQSLRLRLQELLHIEGMIDQLVLLVRRQKSLAVEHAQAVAEAERLDFLADHRGAMENLRSTRYLSTLRMENREYGIAGMRSGSLPKDDADRGAMVMSSMGSLRVKLRALPHKKSTRFYSATGDGQDICNAAFWYCGPDNGLRTGLFGVRIAFPGSAIEEDDDEEAAVESRSRSRSRISTGRRQFATTSPASSDRSLPKSAEASREEEIHRKAERDAKREERRARFNAKRAERLKASNSRGKPPRPRDKAASKAAASSEEMPTLQASSSDEEVDTMDTLSMNFPTFNQVQAKWAEILPPHALGPQKTPKRLPPKAAPKDSDGPRGRPGSQERPTSQESDTSLLDFSNMFSEHGRLATKFGGFGGADLSAQRVQVLDAANEADFGFRATAIRLATENERNSTYYAKVRDRALRGGAIPSGPLRVWLRKRALLLKGEEPSAGELAAQNEELVSDGDMTVSTSESEDDQLAFARGDERPQSAGVAAQRSRRKQRLERAEERRAQIAWIRRRARVAPLLDVFEPMKDKAQGAEQFPVDDFPDMWERHTDIPRSQGGHGTSSLYYVHVASGQSLWNVPTWNMHRVLETQAFEAAARAARAKRGGTPSTYDARVQSEEKESKPVPRMVQFGRPVKEIVTARSVEQEFRRMAPDAAQELFDRDSLCWKRFAEMEPHARESVRKRTVVRQLDLDLRDRPHWWSSLGLRDALAKESLPVGVAGFVSYKLDEEGGVDEYTTSVERQTERVHKLLENAQREHRSVELAILAKQRHIEAVMGKGMLEYHPPASVQALVNQSIDLTDAREKQRLVKQRTRRGSVTREIGMSGFESRGFQGIIAPDGSLLSWAGNGTEFRMEEFRRRLGAKPWRLNTALLQHASTQLHNQRYGAATQMKQQAMEDLLQQGGAADLLLHYRLGTPGPGGNSAVVDALSHAEAGLQSAHGLEHARNRLADLQQVSKDLMGRDHTILDTVKDHMIEQRRVHAKEVRLESDLMARQIGEGDVFAEQLRITWGWKESAEFATAQRVAMEEGGSHFQRCEGELGTGAIPVFLWVAWTARERDAITDIAIGPADPYSTELGAELQNQGYSVVTHEDALEGYGVWVNKGGARAVRAVACSNSRRTAEARKEQAFAQVTGTWNAEFLSPEAGLWVNKVQGDESMCSSMSSSLRRACETERSILAAYIATLEEQEEEHEAHAESAAMDHELMERELRVVRAETKRVKRLLAHAEALMQEADEEIVLAAATDMAGLGVAEVQGLAKAFKQITRFHQHVASVEDLDGILGLPHRGISEMFWCFMDAEINPEVVSLSSFFRTYVVPASFGVTELCAYLFFFAAGNMQQVVRRAPRSRPPSRGTYTALGELAEAPVEFWKASVAQERLRGSDAHRHTLLCVFRGAQTQWSGICREEDHAVRVHSRGVRLVLQFLAPDADAGAVEEVLAQHDERMTIDFLSFYMALLRRPELLAPLFAWQRALRTSIMGSKWWSERLDTFAKAREAMHARIQVMSSLVPHQKTAEEALAELA